ncbi:hypothetical protein FZEAL_9832 [Fusarium zealandicum]|uniref:Fungal STAND N-terminal Goodbye domain-containing protein n=1 Tax=Fusarium zealandicum TaxID=1053134 RepID=A0A8H4U876_9HYPO|nr:hypothetical protein FZEAL_9832 [Fusarium zealandicum]
MSPNTEPSQPRGLEEDSRDVADLWKDALKAYKGIVGFDLEKKFDSVDAMIKQGSNEMDNFHKFRHDEKKVDRLRTLFASNLDYIEQGTQQLVSAAVPAFPPAAAIGTAITYMLGACRQVSADYDIVVVFFEDMNSFLQRIVILETRMPQHKTYQNCLMEVFTSFLTMCGYAHKYIELGRFKKWISNLLHGEDSELSGARRTMDTRLSRLQNATEFAILGNTEEIKKMSLELRSNQQSHAAMLEEQMQVMGTIRDTTETIRNDMAKLLKAFNEQKKQKGDQRSKNAADQSIPTAAKRIRNMLPEVEGDEHEYYILKDTIVNDTCNWVFDQPEWDEWLAKDEGSRSLLAITGQPGSGKSHIGATVYDKLMQEARNDASKHTCAAHFYFREQTQSLSDFLSAVITTINQILEQNAPICELLNAEWVKDETEIDVMKPDNLTRGLLGPAFSKTSKNHLYLMLDGIDELKELSLFAEFLKIVREEGLRISIVVTSRPHVLPAISEVVPVLNIKVEKKKQMQDLKTLVWNRLSSLSALRNFGRYVKQRVADRVEEFAPNMLYAEHMLLRFNALNREGAVLRNLDKPLPEGLHDLYEIVVEECYRRTGSNHQRLVNRLLHWVAHSFRALSLDEVVSLARSWADDNDFDLEEIPEPFDKFLRVGDPGADAEALAKIRAQGQWITGVNQLEKSQETFSPDTVYDDGALPVKFHERSMRSFFREAPKQEASLRWNTSEAHRQIFLDCAKLACVTGQDRTKINTLLKHYTTEYLVAHWQQIDVREHSVDEQAEVMEAFGSTMLNKPVYSTMLEWHGADYAAKFPDRVFDRISEWAKLIANTKPKLSQDVAQWWDEMVENPRNALVHLVKGHLRKLYKAPDSPSALISFQAVKSALQASNHNGMLVDQARKNFGDAVGDTSEPLTEDQASLAMEGLFEDVEMGASGYRAVAWLLLDHSYSDEAGMTGLKALEKAEEPLEKVFDLEVMARAHFPDELEKAYEYINSCLENINHESIPAWVKRMCYTTKARIQTCQEKTDEAAESFMQAKQSDPTTLTHGDALDEELSLFTKTKDTERWIATLKRWSPLERLTWMTWQYDDFGAERHRYLRNATAETAETDFVIQMYEQSIQYLDNVNAAAPIRCELALVHLEVLQETETARKVLDEVLDSGSTGYPYAVTDCYPDALLGHIIGYQSDVLYRLFRQSQDREVKAQLLQAVEGLLTRPLALDVPVYSETDLFQCPLVLARMYRKMGPVHEFQKTLERVMDTCILALKDKVGWNDIDNLVYLATALYILSQTAKNRDKLRRAARILISAQFSRLDPETKDDDSDGEDYSGSESEYSESDDEESPTDEGDLVESINPLFCEGACDGTKFKWWGGRTAYCCMTCYDGFFCEDCYEKRQAANRGDEPLKSRQYCGRDHEYLKLPIEGWQGVKDGKVMMEGEEPIEFQEFLRQVRDELCKEAWESFWEG